MMPPPDDGSAARSPNSAVSCAACRPASSPGSDRSARPRPCPATTPAIADTSGERARRCARGSASSSSSPFHSTSPIRVAFGVETDIPGELDSRTSVSGSTINLDAEQMRDPARDHVAQRREPAPPGGEIERHVETVAALPIAPRHCPRSARRCRSAPAGRAWTTSGDTGAASGRRSSPRRRRSASPRAASGAAAGRTARPRAARTDRRSRRAHCAGSRARVD